MEKQVRERRADKVVVLLELIDSVTGSMNRKRDWRVGSLSTGSLCTGSLPTSVVRGWCNQALQRLKNVSLIECRTGCQRIVENKRAVECDVNRAVVRRWTGRA